MHGYDFPRPGVPPVHGIAGDSLPRSQADATDTGHGTGSVDAANPTALLPPVGVADMNCPDLWAYLGPNRHALLHVEARRAGGPGVA